MMNLVPRALPSVPLVALVDKVGWACVGAVDESQARTCGTIVQARATTNRNWTGIYCEHSTDSLCQVVEVSPDLVNWTADTTRTRHFNNGDGTATETWTANTAEVHQYMRLRVTQPSARRGPKRVVAWLCKTR
jgi:hypothetical protein